MNILITNQQSNLSISTPSVQAIVKAVIKLENQHCEEVSIYFVTEDKICELHDTFFNDPSLTDCISFPMDEFENDHYRVLGDVFVCPETAIKYASTRKVDPYEETTLYIIHGLLHLMGYDDIEQNKRSKMRTAERKHLSNLKKLNLYLS